MTARSFVTEAEGLARALHATKAAVGRASGGIVFVSGQLALAAPRVAETVRSVWRGVPFCVVPAAGVLTERGEVEAAAAASGLLWSDGIAEAFSIGEDDDVGAAVGRAFGEDRASSHTAVLFASTQFDADRLAEARVRAPRVTLFGAGTVGAPPIGYRSDGQELTGECVGLAIKKLAPLVKSSPACRLLTRLEPIDEVTGSGLVLRVGGVPALDKLSACATATTVKPGVDAPHPVVFAALGDDEQFIVRPLRGIDPGRRAVLVGPDARVGVGLGFAVRDAQAARGGVEAMARDIAKGALGSAPRFALYITCAGRGQGLYGSRDVESRILRQRFGDLPIAGMHAAFEIVPWSDGDARLALYTGLLALFRSPS